MKKTKIKDIFTFDNVINDSDSIFNFLSDSSIYPLVTDFIKSENIDALKQDYYLSHSADKYVSPLVEKFIENYNDTEHSKQWFINNHIAKIIYNRFADKWKHIYDALIVEYSPLENYSMEETRTPNLTHSESQNAKSKVETQRNTSASNSYSGFNTTDPAVINKTEGDEDTTTTGASEDNEVTKTATDTGTETLTRSGNIGVTTSQQMLESEFKVRQYDFYKNMFKDIDSVLCLSIY